MTKSTAVSSETVKAVVKHLGLAVGLTVATVALSRPAAAQNCPTYGCEVEIIPIGDDNYVIHAVAVFPTTWFTKAPAGSATFTVNGGAEDSVAITWSTSTYGCCCPDDWNGEFASVLGPEQLRAPLNPNDVVEVSFGTAERCIGRVPPSLKQEGGTGLLGRSR